MRRLAAAGCAVTTLALLAVLTVVAVTITTGTALRMRAAHASIGTVTVGQGLKPGTVPPQYEPLVRQAGTICPEITAPLLAAQIEAESNWNPRAGSSAGAQGIAQFMPATWETHGRDHNGDGTANVMDPSDAIPSQGQHMCDLVNQVRAAGIFGDIVDLTLAAYNAGLGAVQQYNGVPRFNETQNYVTKIRTLATKYTAAAPPTVGIGGWAVPAVGTCTSGFGTRWGQQHNGQDIAGPIRTPIHAAASGTVIDSGPASGYGLWVRIQHPGGITTTYGHNHRNLVTSGQQVHAGQPIAEIGNRGQSTGAHVHFQIETPNGAVDPVAYFQAHNAPELCANTS